MTPKQATWLRKLRDEGSQVRMQENDDVSFSMWHEGFLIFEWRDPQTDGITFEGLAALEAYERNKE